MERMNAACDHQASLLEGEQLSLLCLHFAFIRDALSVLPPVRTQAKLKQKEQALQCSDLITPVLFALKVGPKAAIS